MDDTEPLGPGTEHYIASCVADGTAPPEEARRLLVEFVRQANAGGLSPRLVEHFAACITAYLEGKKILLPATQEGRDKPVGVPVKTLEKAFGLTRVAPGKPRVDDDTLSVVAMEVLELRLAGESLESAAWTVAEDRKSRGQQVSSESQVREAWASHRVEGLLFMRVGRVVDGPAWTREELERLNEIYSGVPGIVPVGMSVAEYWQTILPGEPLPQTLTLNNPDDKPA